MSAKLFGSWAAMVLRKCEASAGLLPSVETATINSAVVGQWYLMLITNYSNNLQHYAKQPKLILAHKMSLILLSVGILNILY